MVRREAVLEAALEAREAEILRLQQRSPSPKRSRPKLRRKRRASPRYVDVSRLERPTASSIARSAARDAGRLDEGIAPDLAAELAYFRAASARHRPMDVHRPRSAPRPVVTPPHVHTPAPRRATSTARPADPSAASSALPPYSICRHAAAAAAAAAAGSPPDTDHQLGAR